MDMESEQSNGNSFQYFIILESRDASRPLASVSPFIIDKAVKGMIGTVNNIKKMKNCGLLIECATKRQVDRKEEYKMLCGIDIKSMAHPTLNSSRGVIRCRDLANLTETEIANEMEDQDVTAVKRIKIKKDGQLKDTHTYILTFNKSIPPKSVKVGYFNVKVDIYIPNPLRCYKCQKYGHHERWCNRSAICQRCGELAHGDGVCSSGPKCVNCGGKHMASAKDCDVWKREKEILKTKYTLIILFPEARQIVQARSQVPSYAAVVQAKVVKQMCDSSTQTEAAEKILQSTPKQSTSPKSVPAVTENNKTSTTCTTTEKTTVNTASTKNGKKPQPQDQLYKNKNRSQSTGRLPKGADDPVQQYNKFGALEAMETEDSPSGSQVAPKQKKTRLQLYFHHKYEYFNDSSSYD